MTYRLTLAELEAFDPEARKVGRERRFLCRFCGDEKPKDDAHRSLSLNTESHLWNCNRCPARGKLVDRWESRDSRDPSRDRSATRDLPRQRRALPPERSDLDAPAEYLCRGTVAATSSSDVPWQVRLRSVVPVAKTPGEQYLLGRGLTAGKAMRAGVRFHRSWFGRPAVLFPFRDARRELVAVHGRYIDRGKPKSRTVGDSAAGVYATPGAFDQETVILVEGPIDALSLYDLGYPAVAAGGCRLPAWVAQALAGRRVLVATDNDRLRPGVGSPGRKAASTWDTLLRAQGADVHRLAPPEGRDWNDLLTSNRGGLRADLEELIPALGSGLRVPAQGVVSVPVT